MTHAHTSRSHTSTGPQTEQEIAATALGNPAHPEGVYGAQMLERMNQSHNSLTNWGLDFIDFSHVTHTLDVGCGGGATIARLLSRMTQAHSQKHTQSHSQSQMHDHTQTQVQAQDGPAHTADKNQNLASSSRHDGASAASPKLCADGVDISETSVKASLAFNAGAVLKGQVHVWQASVDNLPLETESYDLLTTVESFYFWPDAVAGLKECWRVLRPGGQMALICDVYETGELSAETRSNIETYRMRVPSPAEFQSYFSQAGFSEVRIELHPEDSWICVLATR